MVAMFDVLEHLRNPLADIRYASNLLQSNGLLIISTGLLDTWIWAWLKGEHWFFQSLKHICVATRHFFEKMVWFACKHPRMKEVFYVRAV